MNSTIRKRPFLSKGVVDGERPLKFELVITFSLGNSNPFVDRSLICFFNILKAFQRKKI